MGSRRSWKLAGLVLAAVAAGCVVLGGPAPDLSQDAAGEPPPGAVGGSRDGAANPPSSPPSSPPSPRPEPPHDSSGITSGEALTADQAEHVVQVAEEFARRWSTPDPGWRARLRDLSTPALADALAGAEPLQPVPRFTEPGVLVFHNPDWARVVVPSDRGDLVLDLVRDGGERRWLVTAVGWRRS